MESAAGALSAPTARPKTKAIAMEGWLRKRSSRGVSTYKSWNERYFVLRGTTLSYYARRRDVKARGTFLLSEGCTVSDVYASRRKGKGTPSSGGGTKESLNSSHRSSLQSNGNNFTGSGQFSTDDESIESFIPPRAPSLRSFDSKGSKSKNCMYCIKISWPDSQEQAKVDRATAEAVAEAAAEQEKKEEEAKVAAARIATRQQRQNSPMTPTQQANRNVAAVPLDEADGIPPITECFSSPEYRGDGEVRTRYTPVALRPGMSRLQLRRTHSSGEVECDAPASPTRQTLSPRSGCLSASPTRPRAGSISSPPTPTGSVHGPFDGRGGPAKIGVTTQTRETGSVSPQRSPSKTSSNGTPLTQNRGKKGSAAVRRSAAEPMPLMPILSRDESDGKVVGCSRRASTGAISPMEQTSNERSLSQRDRGEMGIQKHYSEQVALESQSHQQTQDEMIRALYIASKKATQRKYKKRAIAGTKIAAATGAAITAGVLTAGVGLAVGLVFVGVSAAAGGSGAAVGAKYGRSGRSSLVLAAMNYEDAVAWKRAIEAAVQSESLGHANKDKEEDDTNTWRDLFTKEGRSLSVCTKPTECISEDAGGRQGAEAPIFAGSAKKSRRVGADMTSGVREVVPKGEEGIGAGEYYVEPGTRWKPLEGGWLTLLGTGSHGLRIFKEEKEAAPPPSFRVRNTGRHVQRIFRMNVSMEGRPFSPLKAQVVLRASPLNAFMCLMSNARIDMDDSDSDSSDGLFPVPVPNSHQVASFRIIERLDDHMDVIHLVSRPLYLFPSWTAPRDFVLFRYWRFEVDGTYIVCYDSVEHRECPPTPGYVRGELHGVYTIAPTKDSRFAGRHASGGSSRAKHSGLGQPECLLTQVVQVDPRGWVPTITFPLLGTQGYGEAFAVSALLQMLDVRDALDHDRFVSVPLDIQPPTQHRARAGFIDLPPSERGGDQATADFPGIERSQSAESVEVGTDEDYVNYDFKYSRREIHYEADVNESIGSLEGLTSISSHPDPLPSTWWAEPDANSFRVRGKAYKKDKKKFNAGPSLFRLIATDIVEVETTIYSGMCTHPKERVQLALEQERRQKATGLPSDMPPYVVAVNIMLPGPPYYHMVFYYAVECMSLIDGSDGTPSSKLANEFFFGESDAFRDKTFKLIPQIVQGNFIVRKAVGSTPAIMGTKLKQTYVRGDRFFEILLDCGSSSVAAGVIRLCNGYAKMIVVDMAFLLEGNDETTLPERVFGCARLKDVDFNKKMRFVEAVEY